MTLNTDIGSMDTVNDRRHTKSGASVLCHLKTIKSIFIVLMVAIVVFIARFLLNTETSISLTGQADLLSARHSQSNIRHLVDVHEFAVRQNTQERILMTKPNTEREIHSIFWYNRPYWVTWTGLNSNCAYDNCKMTDNPGDMTSHSAIVYTLSKSLGIYPPLPRKTTRKDQVWVLFYLEPPHHLYAHIRKLFWFYKWRDSFNWTMTYRLDSDIPLPYGTLVTRTKHINRNYSQIYQRKRKFAAWVVSNCGAPSCRDEYVYELRKYGVQVDVFGVCGNYGNWTTRPQLENMLNTDYKFFFAFENSLCRDYITEKFFTNYNLDIVLVVRGGGDYEQLLPTGGFIDSSKFQSPKELSDYIVKVSANETMYTNYLRTKDLYEAFGADKVNEYSYCKLCDKLNNKQANVNVYDNILNFVYEENNCAATTDVKCRTFTTVILVLIIGSCIFITVIVVFMYKYLPRKVF